MSKPHTTPCSGNRQYRSLDRLKSEDAKLAEYFFCEECQTVARFRDASRAHPHDSVDVADVIRQISLHQSSSGHSRGRELFYALSRLCRDQHSNSSNVSALPHMADEPGCDQGGVVVLYTWPEKPAVLPDSARVAGPLGICEVRAFRA